MLCKHHFSKNKQVFFHIFWVVTLIMQSRTNLVGIVVWFVLGSLLVVAMTKHEQRKGVALSEA
ncbi:hypothetical protein EFP44_13830 [Lacticaseibacillus paracasei]|nr:hypothetical protein [Lacticaseibacillus paracasei]